MIDGNACPDFLALLEVTEEALSDCLELRCDTATYGNQRIFELSHSGLLGSVFLTMATRQGTVQAAARSVANTVAYFSFQLVRSAAADYRG